MKPTHVMLNNQHYRYAVYDNPNTDQYGIFLLGALQEIESVSFFSEYFSQFINVVVVELPGTGLNPPISSRYSILDQANMLIDFTNSLNIDSFHLLTFSYGTAVCLEVYKACDGVLSISIAGGADGIPEAGRENTMLMLSDSLRNPKEFAQTFVNSLTVEDKNIPRNKAIVRQIKSKVAQYSKERLLSFCENTLRLLVFRPSYDISEINIPCSVCVGEKDPYVTKKNAMDFSKKIPSCKFYIIKNTDHFIHLEQPQETASLMIQPVLDYQNNRRFEKVA